MPYVEKALIYDCLVNMAVSMAKVGVYFIGSYKISPGINISQIRSRICLKVVIPILW